MGALLCDTSTFLTEQANLSSLQCSELIENNRYDQILEEALTSNENLSKKERFTLHLRLATWYHFSTIHSNLESMKRHLKEAKELVEDEQAMQALNGQLYLEQSLFYKRIAQQAEDAEKQKLSALSASLAEKAVTILTSSPHPVDELYRAHTYAGFQCLLSEKLTEATAHFEKAKGLESDVNKTYQWGNAYYLITYYKKIGNDPLRKAAIQKGLDLIPEVTDLFDKAVLKKLIEQAAC